MQAPDYKAIREALETILSRDSLLPSEDNRRAQEGLAIIAELEKISGIALQSVPGRFISMEEAQAKRAVFKTEFGPDNSKLPPLLQFNALLISADILAQLAKFKKYGKKTQLIQAYPACDYREENGRRIPTSYTQVFVAIDQNGDPILSSDLQEADLADINEGITDSHLMITAGKDVADEIRHCPPESCKDIS